MDTRPYHSGGGDAPSWFGVSSDRFRYRRLQTSLQPRGEWQLAWIWVHWTALFCKACWASGQRTRPGTRQVTFVECCGGDSRMGRTYELVSRSVRVSLCSKIGYHAASIPSMHLINVAFYPSKRSIVEAHSLLFEPTCLDSAFTSDKTDSALHSQACLPHVVDCLQVSSLISVRAT